MEICIIENGAMVKLKATLEIEKRKADEEMQENLRHTAVVEPLSLFLFNLCAEAVKNRRAGEYSFYLYIYDAGLLHKFYRSLPENLRTYNFEKECKDFDAACVLLKQMLEKANYRLNSSYTYSKNWCSRSDRLGAISFEALD